VSVGVIGLGYVGLPLAVAFAEAGERVVAVDVDESKVAAVVAGESYIEDVTSEALQGARNLITATTHYAPLARTDAVIICVPTPLTANREPDLSALLGAARELGRVLQSGQLVVLESTTYPGTTREQLAPLLERESGLRVGDGLNVAYSPERVDPGRTDFTLQNTPKVVGGLTGECVARAADLYSRICGRIETVSSPEAAELTKLLENIFRSVNIALVNELAILCDRMGIDIWEVVDAAATKPFGFMRFSPGPGLGGHCIPIDPFYLSWKAREFGFYTEFIELAGKVNEEMPYFCRSLVSQALNHHAKRAMKGSRILVLGVAYKPDIGDLRESPALKLISLLQNAGAEVSYHDPYVPHIREQDVELSSVAYEPRAHDCAVIVTDHSTLDYDRLVDEAPLVVDLRNATGAKGSAAEHVFKL
jgi:UDP-N-acetyl-D-glucosamine dehydrogenase